jgi:hypothetical protein
MKTKNDRLCDGRFFSHESQDQDEKKTSPGVHSLEEITGKQCQEAMGTAVDDVNLVQGDSVNDLLALLEFTFWTLDESGLLSGGVVVTCSSK